jgi:mutator protein MutT
MNSSPERQPQAIQNPESRIQNRVTDVAAGLIFRDGKLLITQRHADTHLGGLWEFPGGKRERDETFEQCLTRELREELGVEVAVVGLFESITHAYAEKTVQLKFFLCRLKAGEPEAIGCASFKWVSQAELNDFKFPAADERLLKKLSASFELW